MNNVSLIGRIGKDIELRTTQSGKSVTSFSIAVTNGFGENKTTHWIGIQAWGKTAEFISKYFSKGSQIAIVGRLQTRNWEDKDGKKIYVTEVVAEEIHFCGNKKEGHLESDGFVPVDDFDELPF